MCELIKLHSAYQLTHDDMPDIAVIKGCVDSEATTHAVLEKRTTNNVIALFWPIVAKLRNEIEQLRSILDLHKQVEQLVNKPIERMPSGSDNDASELPPQSNRVEGGVHFGIG